MIDTDTNGITVLLNETRQLASFLCSTRTNVDVIQAFGRKCLLEVLG